MTEFEICIYTQSSSLYFSEQLRRSPIYDLCLGMQFVPQEFTNLQVSREEFLCMKALMLLNTGNKSSVFSL